MVFDLKVCYETGGSFGSFDEESILDFGFKNIETAEENLIRIEEHNKMVKEYYDGGAIPNEFKSKMWFVNPSEKELENFGSYFYSFYSIMLVDDNGNEFRYSTSEWVGYFETLYIIEIIVRRD